MKANTATFCLAAVVGAFCLGTAARADDWGSPSSSTLLPKVERDINQAAGIVVDKSPADDVDSQVKDLEATRAAIDQQKKPAISLSVSGWVSQEVQYNAKQ